MTLLNDTFREGMLDNGMYYAFENHPCMRFRGRVRVKSGFFSQGDRDDGLSHVKEHFIATRIDRDILARMGKGLSKKITTHSASVDLSCTNYYFGGFMNGIDGLDEFFSILSENLIKLPLDSSLFRKHKRIVWREIVEDQLEEKRADIEFNNALFGKGNIFSRTFHDKVALRRLKFNDVVDFHGANYNASNMDIILAGTLPGNIEDVIRKHFSGIPSGEKASREIRVYPYLKEQTTIMLPAPDLVDYKDKKDSCVEVHIGFVVPDIRKPIFRAISLLTKLFGEREESILYQRIREGMGITYRINADYDGMHNNGVVHVYSKFSKKDYERAIDSIFEEMGKLRSLHIRRGLLETYIEREKEEVAEALEVCEGRIGLIENRHDRDYDPEREFRLMEKITPSMLRYVAARYFPESRANGGYVLMIRNPFYHGEPQIIHRAV